MESILKLFQVKDGDVFQRSVCRGKSGPICGEKRDNNTSRKDQVSKHFNVFFSHNASVPKHHHSWVFPFFTQGFSSITFLYHLSLFILLVCWLTGWLSDWSTGWMADCVNERYEESVRVMCLGLLLFPSLSLSTFRKQAHQEQDQSLIHFFALIFRYIVSKLTPNEQRSVA